MNTSKKRGLDWCDILSGWCTLPCVGAISEKVGCINVSFYNHKNIKQMVSKIKDPLPIGNRSGVCRLNCCECDAKYVGRTYRKLKTKCEEKWDNFTNIFRPKRCTTHSKVTL